MLKGLTLEKTIETAQRMESAVHSAESLSTTPDVFQPEEVNEVQYKNATHKAPTHFTLPHTTLLPMLQMR